MAIPQDALMAARKAMADGSPDKAWEQYSQIIRQVGYDPGLAFEASIAGLRSGHVAEAASLAGSVVKHQPERGEGWAVYGEILLSMGKTTEAIPALRNAQNRLPGHPQVLRLMGQAKEMAGALAEAAACYRDALRRAPGDPMFHGLLGMVLARMGRAREAIPPLERAAAENHAPFAIHACLGGMKLLASGEADARPHFERAVAMMKNALKTGSYDDALTMEAELVRWFIRPIEDETHAEACFAQWRDSMTDAGARAARQENLPQRAPGRVGPPVVGFFIHAASTLAHVELTLDYLDAARAGGISLVPRLYVFQGTSPDLAEQANRRGYAVSFVESEWPHGKNPMPYRRLLWLRDRLTRDGVDALVWISLQTYVHFAAALGLAPANVFWAMRFHPVASPHIHGYLSCGSCFERQSTIHGRQWTVLPIAFTDLKGQERASEVAAIRHSLGNPKIILGTLARVEKMLGDRWLEAVGLALKACPEAIFLWAGRSEDARVAGALETMGVRSQCRFVGWVDTRLYAQVLDIFLDTAPVGCGMTAMEAMAWGKPLVSFKDPLTNWGQCLLPVLDGRVDDPESKREIERIFALKSAQPLLAWADTPADYAALTRRLIDDEEFRASVGAAGRKFTTRYFGNPAYAAKRMADTIRAAIDSIC